MYTFPYILPFIIAVTHSFPGPNYCHEYQNGLGDWIGDCSKRGLLSTIVVYRKRLNKLNLAQNEINAIGANAFKDVGQDILEEIIISHNNLRYIHHLAFNGLNKLRYLDLSNNHIADLPRQIFSGNYLLMHLNLSFNEISTDIGLSADSLQVLDLSNCQLSSVPIACIENSPNLQYLNISSNRILRLSKYEFKSANLKEIQMKRNYIRCNDETSEVINWFRKLSIEVTTHCIYNRRFDLNSDSELIAVPQAAPIGHLKNSRDYQVQRDDKASVIKSPFPVFQVILLVSNLLVTLIVLLLLVSILIYYKRSKRKIETEHELEDEAPPPYRVG